MITESDQRAVASHARNAGVLGYLGRDGRHPIIASPESRDDPYLHAGSHPEIVERIWDEIGPRVDSAERVLLGGTPGLFLRQGGLVVAAALGTEYALRLEPGMLREARRAGARTEHRYSVGDVVLDLAATFGDDWVFGRWDAAEPEWCASSARAFRAGA